ncbi:signal peptide protein [Klebsiella pneumoniae]|uniref:Signal peptide protein n=1 Tax=Klebsiella pneumoniae TaxID=573 RepID=A0A378B1T7_KLEPN|nr:signal peptide protein [Klebsiella pneumoniae]
MKDKDEQTALIGMAIGAAVISLVATQKQINQGSIVDETGEAGQTEGDGVEDEVFVQAPGW